MDTDPRLAATGVAVIGCGGLGSNVAHMLVRAGVGHLTLIDFDVVSESNLNRQFFFDFQVGMPKTEALAQSLYRIRPDVDLVLLQERMVAQVLADTVSGADVIVEAVDSAETKAMITAVMMDKLPGVPLVTASGIAGYGSANSIATERLGEYVYLVGDLTSDASTGMRLYATRVMVAAAAQAHMTVRLLLGETEP